MPPDPTFEVHAPADEPIGETLLVGLSHPGMAGVTMADYLIRHLDSEQVGHVSSQGLPPVTPFQAGEPRHATRLYHLDGTELSVLLGEPFIPVWAAHAFTDALVEWATSAGVEEIAILYGVPFPHGPAEHAVFHVSTPSYRERRLDDTDIQPLGGGFLDGVVGEIVGRGLDDRAPSVGVYITPAHPPGPDIDASLLLLDAIQSVYGFAVDETALRTRSEELKRYYQELAKRIGSADDGAEPLAGREYPEDQMFM